MEKAGYWSTGRRRWHRETNKHKTDKEVSYVGMSWMAEQQGIGEDVGVFGGY